MYQNKSLLPPINQKLISGKLEACPLSPIPSSRISPRTGRPPTRCCPESPGRRRLPGKMLRAPHCPLVELLQAGALPWGRPRPGEPPSHRHPTLPRRLSPQDHTTSSDSRPLSPWESTASLAAFFSSLFSLPPLRCRSSHLLSPSPFALLPLFPSLSLLLFL